MKHEVIRGITVRESAFELLSYYQIREVVDAALKMFNLGDDYFKGKGLVIRSLENNDKSLGVYSCKNKTVSIYRRQLKHLPKLLTQSVLFHELVHAIQHADAYFGLHVVNREILSIETTSNRVWKGKYYRTPTEIEAFSAQYSYLHAQGMEVLMEGWVKKFAEVGISLPEVAKEIFG